MEIQLDKNYYIQSDKYSFRLGQYKIVKGERIFYPEKFYGTFVSAMKGYITEKQLKSKANSFKQLKSELDEIKSKLEDIYSYIRENDVEVKKV